MKDFYLVRWDDSHFPLLYSECHRFIIDGENPVNGFRAIHLTPRGVVDLGVYLTIDDAKSIISVEANRASVHKQFMTMPKPTKPKMVIVP